MARRHISRAASFGTGMAAAGYGWSDLGAPHGLAGLAGSVAAGAALWPLAVMYALFGIPALIGGIWPADWRRRWRHRRRWILFGRRLTRKDRTSGDVPAWMRRVVFAADRHGCVRCGSDIQLNADHIFPDSLGGRTILWNLMTLCGSCNRAKSNAWIYRHGVLWPGRCTNPRLAAEILAIERGWYRYSPARWYRAAWELGA